MPSLAVHAYKCAIRWAFNQLYREFAWSYDLVAWLVSRGLWRRWTMAALPYLHGRVLEVGFGPGHLQLALTGNPDLSAAGIDPSPQMVALASRRLRRAGHSPRLLRGVAQALPFASASFDTLLATFPAEYILDPRAHAEFRRVLAPAGRLVIVDGARFSRAGLYERLVDLAYRLTLQAPVQRDEPPLQRLDQLQLAGLHLETHEVQVGPSSVLVLVQHFGSPLGVRP